MGKLSEQKFNELLETFKELHNESIEMGKHILQLEKEIAEDFKAFVAKQEGRDKTEAVEKYIETLRADYGCVDENGNMIINTFKTIMFLNDLEREMIGEVATEQTSLFQLTECLSIPQQNELVAYLKEVAREAIEKGV